MATQRPALKDIIQRVEQDMISRLETGTPARLSMVRILARAEAGLAHALYGYIDTKEKNFLPDTGDEATVLRWADLLNVTRISAESATGTVQATGTDGKVIPAGRTLQSSDGIEYTVDADVTVASGIAAITVTASDRGTGGNLDAGETLTFTQPIPGVLSSVTVQSGGIAGGADIETIEALRVRVLDRLKTQSGVGNADDYEKWAKEAHTSVTRVWVSGQELSDNSVTVRFTTDDVEGGPIPDSTIVDIVQAYIDARRPVTADVYVVAPIADALNLSIAISPTTQAVKDAITAELADLIRRESAPGGTILKTHLDEAISNSSGESDHNMTVPSGNSTHATGHIAVLGTITWSAL